ncbi:MAG TPA: hypothetical protein VMB71_10430, partial [Acetobacteraceae bacterium]|nr:hypothetical protein [Acetobacteraceae bacterium]
MTDFLHQRRDGGRNIRRDVWFDRIFVGKDDARMWAFFSRPKAKQIGNRGLVISEKYPPLFMACREDFII